MQLAMHPGHPVELYQMQEPRPDAVCRRDKSLSALAHELISKYGKEGTEIDLDEVQVRWRRGSPLSSDLHATGVGVCPRQLPALGDKPPAP